MSLVVGTVKPGINGLLVPASDSTALALAMTKLIEDESLREVMGRNSRHYAEKKYSDSMVAKQVVSALDLSR